MSNVAIDLGMTCSFQERAAAQFLDARASQYLYGVAKNGPHEDERENDMAIFLRDWIDACEAARLLSIVVRSRLGLTVADQYFA